MESTSLLLRSRELIVPDTQVKGILVSNYCQSWVDMQPLPLGDPEGPTKCIATVVDTCTIFNFFGA